MHRTARTLFAVLFYSLLCYAGLLLFSVNYLAIVAGLDPSWAFAMNRFAHGPLKFGADLVCTYGPLAYLALPQYVDSNLAIAVPVHIAIWGILLYLLVALWDSGKQAGALIFTVGLICSNRLYYFYWDYFLSAILILLFIHLLQRPRSRSALVLLALITGLSFLVKFTGFILAMLLLVIYALFRLFPPGKTTSTERRLLLLILLSGPLAYLLYNPSLAGLAGYIRGALEISTGYSEVMSLPIGQDLGVQAELLCSMLAACAIVAVLTKMVSPAGAALVIATGWVAFKHGYVRSGVSHSAVFFCFAILALAFLLAQISYTPRRAGAYFGFMAIFSAIALQGATGRWPVWTRFWWLPEANLSQAAGLMKWRQAIDAMDQVSRDSLQAAPINQYSALPAHARVLFFPWDVSEGARLPITTVPLFATQAYSAYTRYLDRKSAIHISRASPKIDYIFFEWKSIDGRHPLVDTPATWNTLFSQFAPVASQGESLLLKPRAAPLALTFHEISKTAYQPSTWIPVPERNTPVALSATLKPTPAGALLTSLFQMPAVLLEVQTRSGLTTDYRVPPDVLSSPFPINTLPLSPGALAILWTRNEISDPVSAIRLTGPGLNSLHCDGYQFYDVAGTGIHITPAPAPLR